MINSCCRGTGYVCKGVGYFVGGTLAIAVAAVALVALPAIALVASIFCGIKAIYHAIAAYYHERKTANEGGERLAARLKRNDAIQPQDIPFIQHEASRLEHVVAYMDAKKWCRGTAKCIIPFIGLFWSLATETQEGGSVHINSDPPPDELMGRRWNRDINRENARVSLGRILIMAQQQDLAMRAAQA